MSDGYGATIPMPDNGLLSLQSCGSANETLDRLLSALAMRKLTVFARVDHAAGAASGWLAVASDRLFHFVRFTLTSK